MATHADTRDGEFNTSNSNSRNDLNFFSIQPSALCFFVWEHKVNIYHAQLKFRNSKSITLNNAQNTNLESHIVPAKHMPSIFRKLYVRNWGYNLSEKGPGTRSFLFLKSVLILSRKVKLITVIQSLFSKFKKYKKSKEVCGKLTTCYGYHIKPTASYQWDVLNPLSYYKLMCCTD